MARIYTVSVPRTTVFVNEFLEISPPIIAAAGRQRPPCLKGAGKLPIGGNLTGGYFCRFGGRKALLGRQHPVDAGVTDCHDQCAHWSRNDMLGDACVKICAQGNETPVIARSVSDVAISSSAATPRIRPINIENLKCTMLIGATCIATPVLEIAPQGHFLALRAQGATARWASQ